MNRSITCLADNETKIDLLNNEGIAKTIVALLREHPDRPVTVGVHGDWGAGKSSVLEMIEAGLTGDERVLCLKFNGWRFQGFEDAKIALIEGIVTALIEKRDLWTKADDAVRDVLSRIDWLKVAKKAGGLAFTAFTGMPAPDQVAGIVSTLQGVLVNPAQAATKEGLESIGGALSSAQSLLKPKEDTPRVSQEIGEFRKSFENLLKRANVDQLIVLIDDLDRCLPDTAIDTLEAIRLFVFTSRTAFVVAADEAMIEYAVRKHFPDLPDTTGPQTYARNYLEKLIQVPFRIPPLGETETRIYVTLMLTGAELGEDSPEFERLLAVARQRLGRPWEHGTLDALAIRNALGDHADRTREALTLSDQLGPILASGTSGNPRQIKRFLNTLLLRQRTAVARGFGDEVRLPTLAKLMLAERFLPRLFDQVATIAATAPDGICPDLGLLEAALGPNDSNGPPAMEPPEGPRDQSKVKQPKRDAPIPAQTPLLAEWQASAGILDWAKIDPPLGNTDLRPYLFVTKDRKDYFGAATALGHLADVAEKLFGTRLAIAGLAGELKKLSEPEAAQIFEVVRGRIIAGDQFARIPAGVDGMAALASAHPALQSNVLDFLERLPVDKLGPWVVSGWVSLLTEVEPVERFNRLLETWATADMNAPLRTAASGARRLTERKR